MTEQMQGCKVLEIDGVEPKRALLEIRGGQYWDGSKPDCLLMRR
jgi:hypothetical protein